MKQFLITAILGLPLYSNAASLCQREPVVDQEFPAGLAGSYELIGKDPQTGDGYTGSLVISYRKTSYALSRSIQGDVVNGDAWIEHCGADKIVFLVARFYGRPASLALSCRLAMDGDNYNRATCKTRYSDHSPWTGLEAWFQTH